MVSCLREKAKKTEEELSELMAWKVVQENKLYLNKKLLEESKAQTELLRKVLKDKEDEISKLKKQLRQAKKDKIKEYRDSNALIKELGGSFADCFYKCFCQVRKFFPDLDLSHIFIDA